MAIYRKKNDRNWYYSVYVPGRTTRLRGSCGTACKAEAELVERTLRLAAGRKSPKAHVLRLVEALYADESPADAIPIGTAYFEASRIRRVENRPVSEDSERKSRNHCDHFAAWCRGSWPAAEDVRDVDRACAQAYASHLLRLGLADKTRRNMIGDLSATWSTLAKAHDGISNPWPLAKPALRSQGRGMPFSAADCRRIFEEGDRQGHGWGLAARIAAATGQRMGDVITIRHEDIVGGVWRLTPRKTCRFGIATLLPLPADLLSRIGSGTGFVMPELGAGYKAADEMRHPFSEVLAALGFEPRKYTFHSFRHYFRSRLAAAGVSDETAMRLGGWTQRDTASRYDHDDHRQELADAINAAWTGC